MQGGKKTTHSSHTRTLQNTVNHHHVTVTVLVRSASSHQGTLTKQPFSALSSLHFHSDTQGKFHEPTLHNSQHRYESGSIINCESLDM